MKIFGTDYDGVIINIEPQKAEALGSILNKAWGVNKSEAAGFWIANGGTPRRYKFDHFYEKQFGKKLSDKNYRVIEAEFSKMLKIQFYPKVTLEPHALELLKYVRSQFDFTFVSSGITMKELRYLVKLNAVAEYFDSILGTNSKYATKRDHFREIISLYKPQQFIFVADGLEDMRVTKEFGVSSIGIPSNHSESELYNAGATNVCTLSESVEVVKKMLNG